MSEYKDQHHVIIDGFELTPVQSNHVVEALENQLGSQLDDMFRDDVDENQKLIGIPATRSLAEVMALVAPSLEFDGIEVTDGKAVFNGELEEFNAPLQDIMDVLATPAEIDAMTVGHLDDLDDIE